MSHQPMASHLTAMYNLDSLSALLQKVQAYVAKCWGTETLVYEGFFTHEHQAICFCHTK